ncbi:hypothetical protein LTR53_003000 [Teratosphaeriaceae sp. CCFEE 6253]|nr:hypothetical protein LTR53_003000 [Teratosphaeriaceae sp. CCFEE 6253]
MFFARRTGSPASFTTSSPWQHASAPTSEYVSSRTESPAAGSPWEHAAIPTSGGGGSFQSPLDLSLGPSSAPSAVASPFVQETLESIIGEPETDELGATINRNVIQAALENAQNLGIDDSAIQYGNSATTDSSLQGYELAPALAPLQLQYCVLHDQLIDAIPHLRFRYNVLKALAAHRLDVESLIRSIRRSGMIVSVQGRRGRDGLVAWGRPDDFRDWEISEAFYLVWRQFLDGCEDWIESTNVWRRSRGESAW